MQWSQKYNILLLTVEKWTCEVAENGNNQVKLPQSELSER